MTRKMFWLGLLWLPALGILSLGVSFIVISITPDPAKPLGTFFSATAAFLVLGGFAHNQDKVQWLWWRMPINHFPINKHYAAFDKDWALEQIRKLGIDVVYQNYLQEQGQREIEFAENTLGRHPTVDVERYWNPKLRAGQNKEQAAAEKGAKLYKSLLDLHLNLISTGFIGQKEVNLKRTLEDLRKEFVLPPRWLGDDPQFKEPWKGKA